MADGKIIFNMDDGRNGSIGFSDIPDDILTKVLMILIDATDAKIDSEGELHTIFYKNRIKEPTRDKFFLETIEQCEYL